MFLHDAKQNVEILCEVIDKSPDIIFTIDLNGKILYCNDTFSSLLGYSKEEIVEKHIRDFAVDEDIYKSCMLNIETTGRCLDQETFFRKKDGTLLHVVKNVNAIYDENGNISYLIVNARDLTHLDELNKSLMHLTKLYEENLKLVYQIFLNIKDAVGILDANGYYIDQNKAHEELLGYSLEELRNKTPTVHMLEETFDKVLLSITEKGSYFGEIEIKDKYGNIKDIELFAFPIKDEKGNTIYYVGIKRDVTKEKEAFFIDKLTGLPNRLKLIEDINIYRDSKLVLINLDSFKEINDVYGYEIGDKVLKALANRIKSICENCYYNVYRIGGDEFAIFINRKIEDSSFHQFIKKIIHYIESESIEIEDFEIKLDITIGISEGNAKDYKNIIERADMALNYARQHKKPYVIYKEELDIQKKYQENQIWIKRLKEALKNHNFIVYYQPIINNHTGNVEKYESLIRMKLGDKIISPIFFLDVAKKSRLYPSITKKVIDESLKLAKNYEISVNLSVLDIFNEEIKDYIIERVKQGNYKLTIEILESEGIENYEEVKKFIDILKEFNCKVALDDFGCGYSNFGHTLKLGFDFLKIDSSLIKDIDKNYQSQIIVETIVNFAKKLGIKTVAEFVHSKEVFEKVKDIGIDYSQGFYLGEPKPYLIT